MLECYLIEHGEKIPGQLRPATIDERDVLVFIKDRSEKAYLQIPASKLTSVKLKGLLNKTLTITARDGNEYYFKARFLKTRFSQIHKLVTFLILSNVEGIEVSADAPERVFIDETFELIITVYNKRPEHIKASNIWFDRYLSAFEIVSAEPPYKSSEDFGIPDCPEFDAYTFTFDEILPPDKIKNFCFKLRPKKQGKFPALISVSDESGKKQSYSLSTNLQTTVIQR